MRQVLSSSLLAGLFISIGCIVNLSVGGGVIGATLFSLGLLSVVNYRLKLYTGTAGFIKQSEFIEYRDLFIILCGNILACVILAFISSYSLPALDSSAIVQKVIDLGYSRCGINAIFCGILMTLAVKFGRKNNWLPLLFSVPVFILSGFRHSIADFYYYSLAGWNFNLLIIWIFEVLGNYIGCNIVRWLLKEN